MEALAVPILRDVSRGLGAEEARWLVDLYYSMQDYRIQTQGQIRSIAQERDEGSFLVGDWLLERFDGMEREVNKSLAVYAAEHVPGEWALSITGIGPVIAAGLLAHIDIEKAPTVGHIWRFAGLDPTVTWGRGEKRPWNAKLKVLCWKIGDSFVKQKSRESDIYGKVYAERKVLEVERNEAGRFSEQAARALEERKIKDKDLRATYEAGRLPAGRLDLRARRYAVKLFLAHWHHVAYEDHFGEPPPKPYVIEHGGHTHFIAPPNWPL